ncbi:bromodomain-containing protein 4-like [Lolium rigidum]|uniref:bromodomain-containing protein 4-like n=1 Tax=Lolium rigidum TaxID=89674 RepID=UPI001F5E15EE|nr:bromodomain-containing protein 4-like [Lolium rigidum]
MKKQHWYSRSRSVPATPRGLPADAIANSPGCMSMVHLIFAPGAGCVGRPPSSDLHAAAVLSNSHHLNSSSSPASHKKGGLEAPRNSLELEGDELRDIQIGVQVLPAFDALAMAGRRSTGSRATAPSSEAGTPRTPSLVARLMGIDGLPEPSPSPNLKKSNNPRTAAVGVKEKKKRVIPESMNRQPLRSLSCNVGANEARSLPDTPRASASSARSASAWDVVDRPRLSLQVLKESVLDRAAQYMSMPSSPTSSSKKKDRKDRDAGHRRRDAKEHAREIVRQAKETVTNRNKSKKQPSSAATVGSNKENVSPVVKDKRMVLVQVQATPAAVKPTAPLSARVQVDQQQHLPHAPRLPPPPPPMRAKPSRPPPPPPPPDHPAPVRARPPDGCERFATRIKKPAAPPCPAPAAPVSFSIAHHHHQRNQPAVASTSSSSTAPVPLEENPEYGYLRSVLERGGFMRATPLPSPRPFKGHSPSSPVDPIVFHLLELDLPTDESPKLGALRHRWNRKLIFHLTQEILAGLLLPDGASATRLHGPALLEKVWEKVRSFPAADCRVVGDIDALVEADHRAAGSVRGLVHQPAVAEEAGDVADEVAEWVLDALLRESLPSSWSWSPSRASR